MSDKIIGYKDAIWVKHPAKFNKELSLSAKSLHIGDAYYVFFNYSSICFVFSNNEWHRYKLGGANISDFRNWNVWTDGESAYYSYIAHGNSQQYKLNMSTLEWETITWVNVEIKQGNHVWYDPVHNHVYYCEPGIVKEWVNRTVLSWADGGLNGWSQSDIDFIDGAYFWIDPADNSEYYTNMGTSYKYDEEHQVWTNYAWGSGYVPSGQYIWTDGVNVYSSDRSSNGQRVLDRSNNSWVAKVWNDVSNIDGGLVCFNGIDAYYTNCILNKDTSTWERQNITYVEHESFSGWNVINLNSHTYLIDQNSELYEYNKATGVFESVPRPDTLSSSIGGSNIWTDGETLYADNGSIHLRYDTDTGTWVENTWINLPAYFMVAGIWSDGNDTYYSYNNAQFILDKGTREWVACTWNVNVDYGADVWKDSKGNTYYQVYDYNTDAHIFYRLNKSTKQWEPYTFAGHEAFDYLHRFYGNSVWHDEAGTTYYSGNASDSQANMQYVLDEDTDTWLPYDWGTNVPYDVRVSLWTDTDGNIYFNKIGTDDQYKLEAEPVYAKDLNEYLDKHGLATLIEQIKDSAGPVANEFVGTQAEWDALTAEEQNAYDKAYIKKEAEETLNEYIGSEEAWNALTAEEQNAYDKAYFV